MGNNITLLLALVILLCLTNAVMAFAEFGLNRWSAGLGWLLAAILYAAGAVDAN